MTWHGSYAYDPYKPLASSQKQMTIQAVALDWRWLFIYPEQKVASINYVRMPVNTPVRFEVTADAPMNSFWIPQLGGQVYAMPGMGTTLHLMADREGTFYGSSANISGKGFARMNFTATASSRSSFDAWVARSQSEPNLTQVRYAEVAMPTTDESPYTFSAPAAGLYDTIISKYMVDDTNMNMEHEQ
jgi:cytochrome o ubiquinol oxidase subunit 2